MGWRDEDMQKLLVGKTAKQVFLADDNQAILFVFEDGTQVIGRADGDCCSHTWIESLDYPEVLVGTPILNAEDIGMPGEEYDKERYECIQFYGIKFTTAKGYCTLDYRNSSNGYYGGSMNWSDGYYYGGVFGQNKSTEQWVLIAGEKDAV